MKLRHKILALLLTSLAGLAAYSLFLEPNMIRTRHVRVEGTRFSGLKGLKILHISDIDIFEMGYRERSLIKKVNSLNPDIIFFTGDFVAGEDGDYNAALTVMRGLSPRLGTWAVPGDSDYRVKGSRELFKGLQEAGVRLLRNEGAQIKANGAVLNVAGLDDATSKRDNAAMAFAGADPGAPTVLLTHSIRGFFQKAGDALTAEARAPKKEDDEPCRTGVRRGWRWEAYDYDGSRRGVDVYFEGSGPHALTASVRECGVSIESIALKVADGRPLDPDEIRKGDIVIRASEVLAGDIHGAWKSRRDSTAKCGTSISEDFHYHLHASPEVSPKSFFTASFNASSGVPYRVFIRTTSHEQCNGSVWVQFGGSLDSEKKPRYRTGQTAPEIRADLVLSGHTHGGQTVFPWWRLLREFTPEETKYIRGLHSAGNSAIHVSPGIGLSRLLPLRFLTPPEITVLEF